MALLKCPDCEKMVSERVVSCPFCGCPKEFFEKPNESTEQDFINKTIEEVEIEDNTEDNIEEDFSKEIEEDKNHIDIGEETQEEIAEEDSDNSFVIAGKKIVIPVSVQNERYLIQKIDPWINKVGSEFDREYSKFSDCKGVIKNSSEIAINSLQGVLHQCILVLNEQGIYSLNENSFYDRYCRDCLDEYLDVVDEIDYQLSMIENKQESEREYRSARKANRGRVVGGGFGLGGALKGMATAGALNAVTGMAHSVGNAIGNTGSGLVAATSKVSLFNNAKSPMRNAVLSAAYLIKHGLREVLRKEAGIVCKYVTRDEEERANSIVHTSCEGRIPLDEELSHLIDALILNPYALNTYERIWDLYGDKSHGLRKMGEYFGVPINDKIKSKIRIISKEVYEKNCSDYINSFNKMEALIRSEANIKETVETLNKVCIEFDVDSDFVPELEKCEQLLESLDRELRTVNDIVYDTREIAAGVRQDYQKYYLLIKTLDITDKSTYDLLLQQDYKTETFKNMLSNLYSKECLLRDAKKIHSNILDVVDRYINKKLIDGEQIVIPNKKGDYEEKEQYIEKVVTMLDDEVPLILFERSKFNKSAILITNKYFRVFSKALMTYEDEMYEIEHIQSIKCVSPDNYSIEGSGDEYENFDLKVKNETAETQIAIGKMLTDIIFIINNLSTNDRINLSTIFNNSVVQSSVPDENRIFCTSCGKKIMRTAKFCNFCGTPNNYTAKSKELEHEV